MHRVPSSPPKTHHWDVLYGSRPLEEAIQDLLPPERRLPEPHRQLSEVLCRPPQQHIACMHTSEGSVAWFCSGTHIKSLPPSPDSPTSSTLGFFTAASDSSIALITILVSIELQGPSRTPGLRGTQVGSSSKSGTGAEEAEVGGAEAAARPLDAVEGFGSEATAAAEALDEEAEEEDAAAEAPLLAEAGATDLEVPDGDITAAPAGRGRPGVPEVA